MKMMSKFDFRELSGPERKKFTEQLAEMLVTIKDKDQMLRLLQSLLTPSELVMLARRLQIAEKLLEGNTYTKIQEQLKVGISTILSVDDWLEHDVRDYQDLRARLKKDQKFKEQKAKSIERQKDTPKSPFDIRHRYPGHFWFLNLLIDN